MTRKSVALAGTFAAFALTVGLTAEVRTASAAAKDVTISEIMKKGHGAKGLLKAIGKEVKEGKWDEAKDDAELLKLFGEGLGKIPPEKGSKESWKKLTDKYKEQTADVYKAVEKKDAKKAGDSLGKIGKSCKECHDAHKG